MCDLLVLGAVPRAAVDQPRERPARREGVVVVEVELHASTDGLSGGKLPGCGGAGRAGERAEPQPVPAIADVAEQARLVGVQTCGERPLQKVKTPVQIDVRPGGGPALVARGDLETGTRYHVRERPVSVVVVQERVLAPVAHIEIEVAVVVIVRPGRSPADASVACHARSLSDLGERVIAVVMEQGISPRARDQVARRGGIEVQPTIVVVVAPDRAVRVRKAAHTGGVAYVFERAVAVVPEELGGLAQPCEDEVRPAVVVVVTPRGRLR